MIAVAAGRLDTTVDRAHDEQALRFLGLVAFRDPLRPGVADAVRACRDAGVRIVIITGDHPVTAHAVAEGLGVPHEDERIATGEDLDAADDDRLAALAATTAIFARTRPDQKFRLVEALQRDHEVVAMTGDGINDAPALRAADIGIAMGERGLAGRARVGDDGAPRRQLRDDRHCDRGRAADLRQPAGRVRVPDRVPRPAAGRRVDPAVRRPPAPAASRVPDPAAAGGPPDGRARVRGGPARAGRDATPAPTRTDVAHRARDARPGPRSRRDARGRGPRAVPPRARRGRGCARRRGRPRSPRS